MAKRPRKIGIPTKYAGVQFRSRLEARWAAMFDLLKWKWEYEPIDLDGYIPDFIVDVRTTAESSIRTVLVEVKPALKLTDYREAQDKIQGSGWAGNAACVGAKIGTDDAWLPRDGACLGTILVDVDSNYARVGTGIWAPWTIRPSAAVVAEWREAGNKVQWRGASATPSTPRGPARTRTDEEERKLSPSEVASFFGNLSAELED